MEELTREQHWNDVYTRKEDTEVSWYEPEATVSLDLIARCEATREARIIDVGGGTSRLVDGLLGLGHMNVSVLDIAEAALAKARERLGDQASRVTWIASDVTTFATDAPYDLWHDRAVFHFLRTEEDKRAYVDVLTRAVVPGGHVLIGTFALDGPERCSGLQVTRYDVQGIASVLGPTFTLVDSLAHAHTTPAGNVQRFTFAHFVRGAMSGIE